jgi:putative transposase
VFAIMDLVTRKWVTELVSIEETSTQVQVVFMDALEIERLMQLVEPRQDAVPADPFPFDADVDVLPPVLLAVSDNGPQMTSCSTRESASSWRCARSRNTSAGPARPPIRPGSRACSAT